MNPDPTPPTPGAALILDAAAIERCLKRIAHEIIERNPDLTKVALIGIPSRGVEIAKRLATYLKEFSGTEPFAGVVDVAMHRDDLHRHRLPPRVERTILPLELDDMTIVLTDDVLFSGRTCRAAMDSISSFGRPARIQYAVLVDRGHRELPIRADYVGKNLPTSLGERVHVRFETTDGMPDAVWMSPS
ncbi:Uracil phosphoribosyltransferase [Chthoniobacter flavus Ellin428]|uniref:Bifunctional protein PyrR n=1 Tax=Chthoniobacter flavus Ellin428 TaxID=497964 RepID=B4D105_9BACT|nr:bifunctional pyr operon transcriptional regulator/uracil phosphoribosyltransferase PyrR [Chthoniobacter flavus]EDY20017.1 Uracil phosphoribosyltransferase [Chthoniobacter flavus Ellin428]TCO93918.1 pyrimidine operon attenuation protein/uracil phosphoribosyltransferase [Chthoniobacter flavus]